jgi:hypothetical protein
MLFSGKLGISERKEAIVENQDYPPGPKGKSQGRSRMVKYGQNRFPLTTRLVIGANTADVIQSQASAY